MDGTKRIVCQNCLGFIARWWVELGQVSKATVSNGRHSAMKELDAWIVEQHPEDSHALMLYADKMNDALLKLEAPNDRTERQPPGEAAACNQTSQETKSADTGKRGGCSLR